MDSSSSIIVAEISSLLAPMNAKMDRLQSTVELLLSKFESMDRMGKPGMTQAQLAMLIGKTPRTISRWVKERKLRLERGMVPHSEIQKFLS